MHRLLLSLLVVLLAGAWPVRSLPAQIDRIRRTAEQEVNRKIDAAVRDAVRCSLGDEACVSRAEREGKPVVITGEDGEPITDEAGNPVQSQEEARRRSQKPGEGVWRNYDFTPGHTVWKATDFTGEPVGRFPARQLEFVRGNMQIVERNGARVLEIVDHGVFRIVLPDTLPRGFTVEFSLKTGAPHLGTWLLTDSLTGTFSRYPHHYVYIVSAPGIYLRGNSVSSTAGTRTMVEDMVPIKLQVDDQYAILYVGAERVAQVPNASFDRGSMLEFRLSGQRNRPTFISDIVVAVGLDKLYEALTRDGVFVTRGIHFDVDKDVLRPESTPVLSDILSTLERHDSLRVIIEGHTDNTGADDHNQQLSERRARAVVAYLTEHGIAGNRLRAVGKGETEPVADNATPEGRQQNRRVVIRLD